MQNVQNDQVKTFEQFWFFGLYFEVSLIWTRVHTGRVSFACAAAHFTQQGWENWLLITGPLRHWAIAHHTMANDIKQNQTTMFPTFAIHQEWDCCLRHFWCHVEGHHHHMGSLFCFNILYVVVLCVVQWIYVIYIGQPCAEQRRGVLFWRSFCVNNDQSVWDMDSCWETLKTLFQLLEQKQLEFLSVLIDILKHNFSLHKVEYTPDPKNPNWLTPLIPAPWSHPEQHLVSCPVWMKWTRLGKAMAFVSAAVSPNHWHQTSGSSI